MLARCVYPDNVPEFFVNVMGPAELGADGCVRIELGSLILGTGAARAPVRCRLVIPLAAFREMRRDAGSFLETVDARH